MVDVVVIVVVVVVVVVVCPTTIFRTGAQRSFGAPRKTVSSPNWSRSCSWTVFFANLVTFEQSTAVPAASVHVLTPIL